MTTKELAIVQLCGHIISIFLISQVIRKQVRILRNHHDSSLQGARRTLSLLAVSVLLGNLVPVTIDTLVIVGRVSRNTPSPVGVLYSASNVIVLVLSAASVLALYVLAERLAATDSE